MLDGIEILGRVRGEEIAHEARVKRRRMKRHGQRALKIWKSGIVDNNSYRISKDVELPFTARPDSFIPTQQGGVLALFDQRVWPDKHNDYTPATGLIVVVQAPGDDPELRQAMRRGMFGQETRAILINFGDNTYQDGEGVRLRHRVGKTIGDTSPMAPSRVIAKNEAFVYPVSLKLVDVLLDRIEQSQPYQELMAAHAQRDFGMAAFNEMHGGGGQVQPASKLTIHNPGDSSLL